ncbi:hypothetical protein AG1IA_07748 [Rhizoctonia solani AG-1 IA]|uniref:Uncharacterized protein n=1 Tax=Thanatephorus cucumeris (strain AG1-IA) TaxID=983506 RepID=L8WJY2_THACA|nr:hypothetical protein AG1IA_07748 [Rhizoctonia solani AG-1 IA]
MDQIPAQGQRVCLDRLPSQATRLSTRPSGRYVMGSVFKTSVKSRGLCKAIGCGESVTRIPWYSGLGRRSKLLLKRKRWEANPAPVETDLPPRMRSSTVSQSLKHHGGKIKIDIMQG